MNDNYIDSFFEGAEMNGTISVIANLDAPGEANGRPNVRDTEIPILPLRNMTLFPNTFLPITVARESAHVLIKKVAATKQAIGVFAQKNEDDEEPSLKGLYKTGVIGRVARIIKLPNNKNTAFMQGFYRVRLIDAIQTADGLRGHVEEYPEILPEPGDPTFQAAIEACKDIADKFSQKREGFKMETALDPGDVNNSVMYLNFLCATLPLSTKEHIMLLEKNDVRDRALSLLTLLNREYQLAMLKADIQMKTAEDLNRQQREFFLKREIENIKEELDEDDDDIQELRMRAKKMKWGETTRKKFDKELEKLERIPQQAPDYNIQYEYLDTLLNLPWNQYTEDRINIGHAKKVLDKAHYGLEKVKERILEHLAVIKLRGDLKSPILCLYGPPGVGKTSLGRSIAESMKRKYVRISLGGVSDEAEIRGHRRTYIGAMPGRIIKGVMDAGSANPVFILDEIDKIGSRQANGDPSAAMLELLDPEQNATFHDNYVDTDFDMSHVLFIATANNISNIPAPLLDRMELIEVNGYLTEEKLEIGKRHLIPQEVESVGLKRGSVKFSTAAIEKIIEDYTRESGVRELRKKINKIVRKAALEHVMDEDDAKDCTELRNPNIKIGPKDIVKYLGVEEFSRDKYANNECAGVVTGLAWTAVGGEILFVETSLSKSQGPKLTLTGNLGDVMKESAVLALEYIKAHAAKWKIDRRVFDQYSVHIHVPEGAVPKDGPSAGITMATSLLSAFTQRKVRSRLAMTGEITLRGKVMPVGGIREKILAAKRAGITDIILCKNNERQIQEIPSNYLEGLTFHYVDNVEDVMRIALLDELVADPIQFEFEEIKKP